MHNVLFSYFIDHVFECIRTFLFALLAWFVKARAIADRSMPKASGDTACRRRIVPANFCETGGFNHIDRANTMWARAVRGSCDLSSYPIPFALAWKMRACPNRVLCSKPNSIVAAGYSETGTMSSQPDTSLSRNACCCVHRDLGMRDLISRPGAKCKLKFPRIIGPL